eukprot:403361557
MMRSFMSLEEIVRCYQSSQIKLNIPETIICTYDSVISYMYTDSKGFLQIKNIKPEQVHQVAVDFQERLYSITSNQTYDGKHMNQRKNMMHLKKQGSTINNNFGSSKYLTKPNFSNSGIQNLDSPSGNQSNAKNPIIKIDKIFIHNIMETNTYLNKKTVGFDKKATSINPNMQDLGDDKGVRNIFSNRNNWKIDQQPNRYEDMVRDSVYGLFFKTPTDIKNVKSSTEEQQSQYDLFYNQVFIQDELDQFPAIKLQYLIEEDCFKESTILDISKDAQIAYQDLIQQAGEVMHFLNLKFLQKQKKQIETIVIDFISDSMTGSNLFLQVKHSSVKDYDKSSVVFDQIDKQVRQRHTRSIDLTFQIAQQKQKKEIIKFYCPGQYCKIEDFQIRKDIPDFHQELIHKISKRNDLRKNQSSNQNSKQQSHQYEPVYQKPHQKRQPSTGSLIKDVKLLPEIQNFEYYIPNVILILDKDIIDKYQEELQVKALKKMTNPSFKELEKRKQEAKEIEQRVKIMMKNQKLLIQERSQQLLRSLNLTPKSLNGAKKLEQNFSLEFGFRPVSQSFKKQREQNSAAKLPPLSSTKRQQSKIIQEEKQQLPESPNKARNIPKSQQLTKLFERKMTIKQIKDIEEGTVEDQLNFIFNDDDKIVNSHQTKGSQNTLSNPLTIRTSSFINKNENPAHSQSPQLKLGGHSGLQIHLIQKDDTQSNVSSKRQTSNLGDRKVFGYEIPSGSPSQRQSPNNRNKTPKHNINANPFQDSDSPDKKNNLNYEEKFEDTSVKFRFKLVKSDTFGDDTLQNVIRKSHRSNNVDLGTDNFGQMHQKVNSYSNFQNSNRNDSYLEQGKRKFIDVKIRHRQTSIDNSRQQQLPMHLRNRSITTATTNTNNSQSNKHYNHRQHQPMKSEQINTIKYKLSINNEAINEEVNFEETKQDFKYTDKQIVSMYLNNKLQVHTLNNYSSKQDKFQFEQKVQDILKRNINNYNLQNELIQETYEKNEPKNMWKQKLKDNIRKNQIKIKAKINMKKIEIIVNWEVGVEYQQRNELAIDVNEAEVIKQEQAIDVEDVEKSVRKEYLKEFTLGQQPISDAIKSQTPAVDLSEYIKPDDISQIFSKPIVAMTISPILPTSNNIVIIGQSNKSSLPQSIAMPSSRLQSTNNMMDQYIINTVRDKKKAYNINEKAGSSSRNDSATPQNILDVNYSEVEVNDNKNEQEGFIVDNYE